jgi:hypothetical protein
MFAHIFVSSAVHLVLAQQRCELTDTPTAMMATNHKPEEDSMPNSQLPHSLVSLSGCDLNLATMTEANDEVEDEAGTKDSSMSSPGDVWQWMQGQLQSIAGLNQDKRNTTNEDNEQKKMDPQEQHLRRRIRDRVSEILSVYVDTSSHNPFDGQHPILAASE